jgi:hypothetical protein
MLIAKIVDGVVTDVADYQSMFAGTSFPSSGPSADFMVQNSCMYVNVFLPYDSQTQKLVAATPYIQVDDPAQPLNWVYTVEVAELTPEEIQQMHDNQAATNQKMASDLLYETDWTTIPDVINQANDPYLTNQEEFIAYRNIIRKIAVNPTWDAVFPEQPTATWSE